MYSASFDMKVGEITIWASPPVWHSGFKMLLGDKLATISERAFIAFWKDGFRSVVHDAEYISDNDVHIMTGKVPDLKAIGV